MEKDRRPLRLLSLDGGGVKGLSSLLILQRIFRTIQHEEKLAEMPRPCDYFDLIGGTSTGGLIAIMLGRLEMHISECIEVFKRFSSEVFGKGTPPSLITKLIKGSTGHAWFDARRLENVVKELLYVRGIDEDTLLRESGSGKCKV